MLKLLLKKPILPIRLSEIHKVNKLDKILSDFDYNERKDEKVFTYQDLEDLSAETQENLATLTGNDLYYGYYWQVTDNPQEVGFWFYSNRQDCLYITNVPYLVLHHSPTGFSWGYMGSGPTDLGLNLGEYFSQKLGWTEPKVELWMGQTASALAYMARTEIRDWLNSVLTTGREHLDYTEVEQTVKHFLAEVKTP